MLTYTSYDPSADPEVPQVNLVSFELQFVPTCPMNLRRFLEFEAVRAVKQAAKIVKLYVILQNPAGM